MSTALHEEKIDFNTILKIQLDGLIRDCSTELEKRTFYSKRLEQELLLANTRIQELEQYIVRRQPRQPRQKYINESNTIQQLVPQTIQSRKEHHQQQQQQQQSIPKRSCSSNNFVNEIHKKLKYGY